MVPGLSIYWMGEWFDARYPKSGKSVSGCWMIQLLVFILVSNSKSGLRSFFLELVRSPKPDAGSLVSWFLILFSLFLNLIPGLALENQSANSANSLPTRLPRATPMPPNRTPQNMESETCFTIGDFCLPTPIMPLHLRSILTG